MDKIVLISCVSKKIDEKAKAKDLYISSLFTKSIKYAYKLYPDKIFILSAKYHLLSLDQIVEPYDVTLNKMSTNEIKDWSNKVIHQLMEEIDMENDEVIFLAGEKYRKFLLPCIKNCHIPMNGLKIGEQLKFLGDIDK